MTETEAGSTGNGNGTDEIRATIKEIWIKSRRAMPLLLIVCLTIIALYTIKAVSDFLVKDSAAALTIRTISERIPQAKQEHDDIIAELQVQSYILAECMRSKSDCPRLRPPSHLENRIIRPLP